MTFRVFYYFCTHVAGLNYFPNIVIEYTNLNVFIFKNHLHLSKEYKTTSEERRKDSLQSAAV